MSGDTCGKTSGTRELANGSDPLLQFLSNAGSLGIMAAAVLAFLRGWIVSGAAHARVLAERDRAHDLVYATIEHTERERRALEKALEDERARRREAEERARGR